MQDVPFYAPKPERIKTIIVVEDNGACQTYADLLSAITAVYHLNPISQQIISGLLNGKYTKHTIEGASE